MTPLFDVLEPWLALSHYPEDANALRGGGFRAILNVCDFGEPSYAHGLGAGVRVIRRPFEDCWPVPFPWLADATLALADLGQRGVPTLVHCHGGRSRSPTVVALYWMARDGIDWRTAVARLRQCRPHIDLDPEGHSRLVSSSTRDRVVESVRAFLRGDAALLAQFRNRAQDLTNRCEQRVADPAAAVGDWNLIEEGLAIGQSIDAWPILARHGFDRILIAQSAPASPLGGPLPSGPPLATYTFPEGETVDPTVLSAAVGQLHRWRRQGHRVFVLGPGQDFFAVLTAVGWLVQSRDWDAASAIWYIGSRRQQVGRYLEMLMEAAPA
jgi:hypothetical protein